MMDENILTIGDFLGFCFPERDIDAEMKRFEAGIDQLQPAFNRVVAGACEAAGRLEDMPPSPGYEPLLVKRGQHLAVARFFSYVWIGLGKKMADEVRTQRTVADAIRFLARPGRTERAISRKAVVLLDSKLVGIFDDEFVESLEACGSRRPHCISTCERDGCGLGATLIGSPGAEGERSEQCA